MYSCQMMASLLCWIIGLQTQAGPPVLLKTTDLGSSYLPSSIMAAFRLCSSKEVSCIAACISLIEMSAAMAENGPEPLRGQRCIGR